MFNFFIELLKKKMFFQISFIFTLTKIALSENSDGSSSFSITCLSHQEPLRDQSPPVSLVNCSIGCLVSLFKNSCCF